MVESEVHGGIMRILLPKLAVDVDFKYGPFFFLAGPVRGGGDWQHKFCQIMQGYIPHFTAALPCRYPSDHPLMQQRDWNHHGEYERQLLWERHYLKIAAQRGCLVFWLAKESASEPRGNGEPYAMETMGEIGEWRGRLLDHPGLRIVVGGEEGFPGLTQIHRNFCYALDAHFPLYGTIEETANAALAKVHR